MAYTDNGRRTAYDNIAAGSATGRELHHLGETVSVQQMVGGGKFVSTSNSEANHSNVAIGVSVTDQGTPENVAVGGAVPSGELLG